MKKWIIRLFYGLLFAIPFMLLTYMFAQASPMPQDVAAQTSSQGLECKECHPAFQAALDTGYHGKAGSNQSFLTAWEQKGKPEDCLKCHVTGYDPATKTWKAAGVTCESCHGTVSTNHPAEPMPVQRASESCGKCHAETYFEWEISRHREKDLQCSVCHDPHGNTLKAENAAALCASCHKARSANFTHTGHSEQGLACKDCHMAKLSTTGEEGHARLDHSFFVSLQSCNSCHAYQMHDPVTVHSEPTPEMVDPMQSAESLSVVATPKAASPLGFAMIAGLIGLAAGVVIAPYLERFQNKRRDDDGRGE